MLDKFKKEITYCTFCPKMCRFACPVAEALDSETLIPSGKLTLLYLLQDKALEINKEMVEVFYKCTTCMACRTYCKHEIEVPQVLEAARALAVREGVTLERVDNLIQVMESSLNPYGEDLKDKLKKIVPERLLNKDTEILYFPGCTAVNYYPEDITDTIRILERLKVKFSVYSGESLSASQRLQAGGEASMCCGFLAKTLGYLDTFEMFKEKNIKLLTKYKTIISGCPECVYALKNEYKLRAEVLHITQFLEKFLTKPLFPNPQKLNYKIIYHDPCYLGRYLGVYEEPRELLSRFCQEKIIEFSWNKEGSACCGWGGGESFIFPEIAKSIAKKRLEEFEESKATLLITACPSCRQMFERANDKIKVKDIINLIAESIS